MLKTMRTIFGILIVIFALYVFRAIDILDSTPIAIGCLIMAVICTVAFLYYSELIKED